MRAPSNPILLVIAAVGIAVASCASQPKQGASSRAVNKPACADDASNPLHLTTLRKREAPPDPQLESLLNQGGGPRLQQINREMYQTLRSLDAELRREQQVAACQRGAADIQSLQAQTTAPDAGSGNRVGSTANSGAGSVAAGGPNVAGAGGSGVGGVGVMGGAAAAGGPSADGIGGAAGVGAFASDGTTVAASSGGIRVGAASGGAAASAGTAVTATSSAGLAGTGATAVNPRAAAIRKASVPPTTTGGGGNGATAQKVSAGSDNDIVARRLRTAAEQETDPTLKAKLWKEYAQYQQGNGAK